MTARAVAKHYAAVIGKVDGVRLISDDRLSKALERPNNGEPKNDTRGLGYGVYDDVNGVFGHGGAGGSNGLGYRKDQLAIGFAKNRMGTSAPETISLGDQIIAEIRAALGLGAG